MLSFNKIEFVERTEQFFIIFSHDPISLKSLWFRLVPFRSPLLGESLLLSFPPATKMFQFTGLPLSYI